MRHQAVSLRAQAALILCRPCYLAVLCANIILWSGCCAGSFYVLGLLRLFVGAEMGKTQNCHHTHTYDVVKQTRIDFGLQWKTNLKERNIYILYIYSINAAPLASWMLMRRAVIWCLPGQRNIIIIRWGWAVPFARISMIAHKYMCVYVRVQFECSAIMIYETKMWVFFLFIF